MEAHKYDASNIKILGGVHRDFQGTLAIGGRIVRPAHPREAGKMGVAVIHQELSLVPSMSVADNLFLGRPLTRVGLVRDGRQRAKRNAHGRANQGVAHGGWKRLRHPSFRGLRSGHSERREA